MADEPDQASGTDFRDRSVVRRRVLDAAQAMVEEAGGLSVTLESVPLEKVIERSGVPRATVYREWSNRAAFHLDLLCDLAGPSWQGTAAFDEETIKLARQVVASRIGDLKTPEGRWRVLREVARQAAHQNFKRLKSSTQWRSYVVISASALSLDDSSRARVLAALREGEATFTQLMGVFYEQMAALLGFRLKPWVPSYQTLAITGAAVVEGLGLRAPIDPENVEIDGGLDLSSTEGMGEGPWHLAAVGFLGVLERLIEIDPGYDPNTALVQYLVEYSEHEASLTHQLLRER